MKADPTPRAHAITASVIGAASALVPMSYDEAYWLGVAKMVESGRVLYEGAIDNKTPPVYALVWLLDALPGPYQLWRGIFVGLLAMWLLNSLRTLAPASSARWRVPTAAVVVVLLAELQLATELVAVGLIASGLALVYRGKATVASALLMLVAVSFDPRALVLLPGAYLVARGRNPDTSKTVGILLAGGVTIGSAIVLSIPGLRFALIELNLSSRLTDLQPGPGHLLLAWVIPVAALSPLAIHMARHPRTPGVLILAIGAIGIATLSLLGIPHYWIYSAVPLVMAPQRASEREHFGLGPILIVLALVPAAASTVGAVRLHLELEHTATDVAGYLDSVLEPGDTYVLFGAMPHLVVKLASQYALAAPTSHYMTAGTSRTKRYRAELVDAIANATAIIDDGGLEVSPEFVFEDHRGTREIFDDHIDDFPCVRSFGSTVVRIRDDRCKTS